MSEDACEALVAAVKADAALIALIGTRFFPQGASPRGGVLPYGTYQEITSESPAAGLDGDGELVAPWIQVDFWHTEPQPARRARRALKAMLGAANTARSLSGFGVQWIRTDGYRMSVERPDEGASDKLFRVGLDVRICHPECED